MRRNVLIFLIWYSGPIITNLRLDVMQKKIWIITRRRNGELLNDGQKLSKKLITFS